MNEEKEKLILEIIMKMRKLTDSEKQQVIDRVEQLRNQPSSLSAEAH